MFEALGPIADAILAERGRVTKRAHELEIGDLITGSHGASEIVILERQEGTRPSVVATCANGTVWRFGWFISVEVSR